MIDNNRNPIGADETIVLVGGRGTRLQSVVRDVPKPLAPVAGRPFLGWLLDRLAACGVRRAILATGHLASQVEAFAGHDWAGMSIAYSREDAPLGTGGAVRQAALGLLGDAAQVVNGDTYLAWDPLALAATARACAAPIGIALARVDDVARYGAVAVVDGRVTAFREKGDRGPGWINAGVYWLDAAGLALLDGHGDAFSLEREVLVPQAAVGGIAAFLHTDDFIDIGVPDDYARAQLLFGQAP